MKKAFDANVSRAKPRLRLGALMTSTLEDESAFNAETVEALAEQVAHEDSVIPSVDTTDLGTALRARAQARALRTTAVEALHEAIAAPAAFHEEPRSFAPPQAFAEPLPTVTEVQAPPAPEGEHQHEASERRERLRERLKAVRENPRPEPLPETVAEAGVLAVERISALQSELTKARAMNLALAQDLEAARRQAERATEEARTRMDEARRLSKEMEGRVTLLSELERELESLEGERNESLLALQETRQLLDVRDREKNELAEVVAKKNEEVLESLAEEERLASELEVAQESMQSLRRSSDVLKSERDTLARQVSELTRERAELLEARKALEAVHRALSSAAMR
jgi:DNA repair exonuclease SbcCD ATPase subunit